MSPLFVFILLCNISYIFCIHAQEEQGSLIKENSRLIRALDGMPIQDPVKENKSHETEKTKNSNDKPELIVNVKSSNPKSDNNNNVKNVMHSVTISNASSTTIKSNGNTTKIDHNNKFSKPIEMESGALLRGVLVIVALSILVVSYMALKTYYSKRNKQPAMVSKYGIRTRRSDIEMTPLPLEEDEDDETLFEVGNVSR